MSDLPQVVIHSPSPRHSTHIIHIYITERVYYIAHTEHGGAHAKRASESTRSLSTEADTPKEIRHTDVRAMKVPTLAGASKRFERTSSSSQSSKQSTIVNDDDNNDASLVQVKCFF